MSILANIPYLPVVHSGADVIYFFYIFMRVTGLFVISPLLTNRSVPVSIRVWFSFFVALVIAITLYPQYREGGAIHPLQELQEGMQAHIVQILLTSVREFAVGYLMGLVFTFIFEALLVGGQIAGVLMGFSIMEIIDPISNTSRPLLGQLFVTTVTLLFLANDFHHAFFREMSHSFLVLPIGDYNLPYELLHQFSKGSARMYEHAMQYVALPYVILFVVTVALGFMAKIMPEMNIFMVGFPIKILIGYFTLIACVGYFPLVLRAAFYEIENLTRILIYHISVGS